MKIMWKTLLAGVWVPALVCAGTVFTMGHKNLADPWQSQTVSTVWIEGRQLRVDLLDASDEPESTLLFDASEGLLRIVNHAQRQYMVMDDAFIERVGGMMRQAREQLSRLPASQRAMVEQMMGSVPPEPVERQPVQWRPGGEEKTVAGVLCTKYQVFEGSDMVAEVWAAAPTAAGVDESDLAVIDDLAKFYTRLLDALPEEMGLPPESGAFTGLRDAEGFPMAIRTFDAQELVGVTLLRDIRSEAVPADRFSVPDGYRELKPDMPAGLPF